MGGRKWQTNTKIDTEIDESGFQKGLKRIEQAAKGATQQTASDAQDAAKQAEQAVSQAAEEAGKTQKKRRNPKPDLSLSNAPHRSSFRCGGFFLQIFWGCSLATDGPDAGWYTKGTLQGMLNQQPGRAGMKTPTFESAFYISAN